MVVTVCNYILYGGPFKQRNTKDARSLGEFILKRFNDLGDKIILIDGVHDKEYTAKDFMSRNLEFARNLSALGIKKGTIVGVCSENRIEFASAIFATLLLNATLAPFNAAYTERELEHVMNLSKPKVMFASVATLNKVVAVARRYSFVQYIVCFDDVTPSKTFLPYSKFLTIFNDKNSSQLFEVKPTNVKETVAIILCSSGTTGLPKGVEITQNNLLHILDGQFLQNSINHESVILNVLPWFHTFGLMHLIVRSTIGSKTVFLPGFQKERFLKCIQKYRVTACLLVTPLMVFLAKHPMVDKFDLSSLKQIYCSAAPLSIELMHAVKKRIGVPVIRKGYGMTESCSSITVETDEHSKEGSVGTVRAETYIKVIDPQTGEALGPNRPGEICAKGDVIMKGYVGDEKATAEIIDSDGWLHTGDIGYYDKDYFFYIVDRMKELIKYKGFQVPPAEIEALLLTNPKIMDAAVVGIPDEVCGELPMAYVVKADSSLTEKEVIDFVAEKSSPAKRLHGGVRFVNEVPKNPSGKIIRKILREMVKSEIKSKL